MTDIVTAKGKVLRNVEPVVLLLVKRLFQKHEKRAPEVEVVDGALLVAHVDVEGEQVDRRLGAPAKHLQERRKTVTPAVSRDEGLVGHD